MDANDVLRPGTLVDINVTSELATQTVASHIVRVVDAALYLDVPGPRSPRTMFASGQSVTLSVKPDDGLYVATTQVLGFTKRGPLSLVVARPTDLECVERRQNVRVPVLIHPEQCEADFGQSTGWLRISPTIINISVGGVLLRHRQLLAEGATVKMQFKLPDGYGPIQAEGRVVARRIERRADPPTYLMGVTFTRIAVEDSAAILRYTLE